MSNVELAPRDVALMEPWLELAESTIGEVLAGSPFRKLVDARDLALATVTFYLGANLLTHLVPDQSEVSRLLETAGRFAPLLEPS